MKRKVTHEFDLLELEAMASDPDAMEAWILENADIVCELLRGSDSQGRTLEDPAVTLRKWLVQYRQIGEDGIRPPKFGDVEEARPGPMSDEEFARMLAGGDRKAPSTRGRS